MMVEAEKTNYLYFSRWDFLYAIREYLSGKDTDEFLLEDVLAYMQDMETDDEIFKNLNFVALLHYPTSISHCRNEEQSYG
jgi:hypothetical protein